MKLEINNRMKIGKFKNNTFLKNFRSNKKSNGNKENHEKNENGNIT